MDSNPTFGGLTLLKVSLRYSLINPLRHSLVITLGSLKQINSSVVQRERKVEGVPSARIMWFS